MKKYKGKILSILMVALCIISIGLNTYAHSGRTDASGGHKDNKNKSGLGSYHYHCGGHPAHLHTNGVCPYSSSKKSTSSASSNKSTTKSTKKSTNTKSTNVKSTTKATTNSTTKAPTQPTVQDATKDPKQENNNVAKTTSTISNNKTPNSTNTNTSASSQDNSNPVGTVLALGILGGGGYLGYKKYHKTKQ